MKIGWDIPQRAAVLTRRQHAATALRGAWGCSADTAGRGRGAHEVELGQSGSKHGKHPLAVSGVSVWSGISEIVWVLCVFPYNIVFPVVGLVFSEFITAHRVQKIFDCHHRVTSQHTPRPLQRVDGQEEEAR